MQGGRYHGGNQSLCLWVKQAATSKGQSDGNHKRSPALLLVALYTKASYVHFYISALNYPPFPLAPISFNRTNLLQLIDADAEK